MINKLITRIKETNAPIVVGLDPMMKFVPEYIKKAAFTEYGETLEGAAEAIWQYNKGIVDAIYDLVPAVKPQVAMYEQFGIPGMVAFKKTVDYCKEKGLIVIGDIKRGDIGSTSEAYAVGHLGKVQVGSKSYYGFDEDFVTVNPYLGSDGVNPFVKICKEEKKGIFVLVKTSNPSSGEFQDQLVNGRPLYELVGEKVAAWGADCMGDSYSYVGAVVGATYPEQGKVLRKVMPKAFILVPGYGAQGGKGADLVHFFNEDGLGAIINSSRGIIAAYQQEKYAQFGEQNYADASRAAVLDMREDIAAHVLEHELADARDRHRAVAQPELVQHDQRGEDHGEDAELAEVLVRDRLVDHDLGQVRHGDDDAAHRDDDDENARHLCHIRFEIFADAQDVPEVDLLLEFLILAVCIALCHKSSSKNLVRRRTGVRAACGRCPSSGRVRPRVRRGCRVRRYVRARAPESGRNPVSYTHLTLPTIA